MRFSDAVTNLTGGMARDLVRSNCGRDSVSTKGERIVSRVSRVSRGVNHDQPFTTAELVGDTGLEPMTSPV